MSELHSEKTEVAVVFRKGNSLLIPPTSLDRTVRQDGELYEKSLLRLCRELEIVNASVDHVIPSSAPQDDEVRTFGYMVEPKHGELDAVEFTPQEEIPSRLESLAGYSRIDAHLVYSAYQLLTLPRRS